MVLRPTAFQIRNYKSISDSGFCTLSGDGVSVLAGQNEAGKSSVLQALWDFDGEPGESPELDDVVPDYDTTLIPTVTMYFEFSWRDLDTRLTEKQLKPSPKLVDYLKLGKLQITRNLLTGAFTFEDELFPVEVPSTEHESAALAESESSITETAVSLQEGAPFADEKAFVDFLYQTWPSFVYFDSFDDLLPRRVSIDRIQKVVASGATSASKATEPELAPAVKSFLAVAKITLAEVRRLAALDDDEKQLRNYLENRSAAISEDFLRFWKQKVGKNQSIRLKVLHTRKADGEYLLFYAEDRGTLHFPSQRSKGFLWFLSFYLSLSSSARGGSQGRGKFILIDEPGSFLHPKAQHDILDMLEKRVVSDGNVVAYSTHSPYLLPADRLDRVRIAFKGEDNRTLVADRINDERLRSDLRGDALAPIWNAIGIEISDTGPGPIADRAELVIVEGITDYYYLHAWCALLDHRLLVDRRILISNGTPMMGYSVSLAIAYAKSFAILLDRDSAGAAAFDKLTKEMNITPGSIVRPHDASAVEDLFSQKDFADLLAANGITVGGDTQLRPAAFLKRQRIDKVLLARKFSELVKTGAVNRTNLEAASVSAAADLLNCLDAAFLIEPIHRIA